MGSRPVWNAHEQAASRLCRWHSTHRVAGTIADHVHLQQVWSGAREEANQLRLEELVPLLTGLPERSTVIIAGVNHWSRRVTPIGAAPRHVDAQERHLLTNVVLVVDIREVRGVFRVALFVRSAELHALDDASSVSPRRRRPCRPKQRTTRPRTRPGTAAGCMSSSETTDGRFSQD